MSDRHRLWPRDPLGAGRGGFSAALHHLPVTLFLIFVSSILAVLTRAGDEKELSRVNFLFLSSPANYQVYKTAYDELDPGKPGYGGRLAEVKRLEAIFKDPWADIKRGQIWRLVTPMFIHLGPFHILFNMMWLWQFGLVLEMRFRWMRFLGLVLLLSAAGNIGQALWSGPAFGGMSGVNYGLFGFLLLRSKLHPSPDFTLNPQTVVTLMLWQVICFTGVAGPIANAAHVVGFLAGAAVGTVNALMAGGGKALKRRHQFRSSMSSGPDTLHRCAVCGKTEKSDPYLEFYVDTDDHQDYCVDHLPPKKS